MDLVVRAAVAFLFVYFLTRVIGRRELSSMEPFDLIMLVMIGDLVQQGVTQNDFSVTGALLVGGDDRADDGRASRTRASGSRACGPRSTASR